jgi:Rrf2 family protein
MRFSSKAHYGLRAALVLAGSHRSGPVPLSEIAREEGISLAYLEQLAARLRKAGLVVSTRGARGGYTLAADPASITAGQVLRALDEDLAPAECVAEARPSGGCGREEACSSRPLWEQVRDSVAGVLDSTTLADLCATPGGIAGKASSVERKR